MPIKYSQEQIDRATKSIPEELKEALFSVETADAIRSASSKQGIMDERLGRIAETAGNVLIGLILPSQFLDILKSDIGLKDTTAEAIAREINRFVFFPVKAALEQLHEMPTPQHVASTPPKISEPAKIAKQSKKQGSDKYRESVE